MNTLVYNGPRNVSVKKDTQAVERGPSLLFQLISVHGFPIQPCPPRSDLPIIVGHHGWGTDSGLVKIAHVRVLLIATRYT